MMVLARWLAVGATILAGCRFNFDDRVPAPPDAPDAPGGLSPPPPVPAAICRVDQYVASVPARADLAINGVAAGYAAIWVDTERAAPAHAIRLDATHQLLGDADLPYLTDTAIGGLIDTGAAVLIASATGATQTLTTTSLDLAAATTRLATPAILPGMGRDPFPYDGEGSRHAVITAGAREFAIALVDADGKVVPANSNSPITTGSLDLFSCTFGPKHGHCVWSSRPPGGQPVCHAADVTLDPVPPPTLAGGQELSADCNELRASSGTVDNDAMLGVWTTSDGRVMADYYRNRDIAAEIASAGSAPKVTFDGARFWIAWIAGDGDLALRSFDQDDAGGTLYALPKWTPRGPEAFELVHRGGETALAVLRDGELDLLTICR